MTRAEAATTFYRLLTDEAKTQYGKAVPDFSDATGSDWLSGYPDGIFRPDGRMTRAEAVKIVNALLGRTPDDTATLDGTPYFDLPKTHWAFAEFFEATKDK